LRRFCGGCHQWESKAEDLPFVGRVGKVLRISDHSGVENCLTGLACTIQIKLQGGQLGGFVREKKLKKVEFSLGDEREPS